MSRLSASHRRTSNAPVVVVAGGAGFLGSHLSESLLNSGATVLALDDLVTGNMSHIKSFRHHPRYEFFECNINQSIPAALLERPITHIIHAAGVETRVTDEELTLASLLTGAFGTKNLLDLGVRVGAKVLLISSINIYEGLASSTSLNYYFGSSANEEAQFSHYEAKRYAETLCEVYAREYNLDVRVARLSEIYGPRMDLHGGSLLAQLIQSTLNGDNLQVMEEGTQEMVLTYVSDVVYGLCRLLFGQDPRLNKSIYSLANPERISLISIAYILRGYLPQGKEVVFLPNRQSRSFPLPHLSLERAKKELE